MANQYRSVLASSGPAPTGNALPSDVLSGKTFTNDNGSQTGTMVNNGAVSQTLAPGQSYTIPEGYHNGTGVISTSAGSLINTNLISLSAKNSDSYKCAINCEGYNTIETVYTSGESVDITDENDTSIGSIPSAGNTIDVSSYGVIFIKCTTNVNATWTYKFTD